MECKAIKNLLKAAGSFFALSIICTQSSLAVDITSRQVLDFKATSDHIDSCKQTLAFNWKNGEYQCSIPLKSVSTDSIRSILNCKPYFLNDQKAERCMLRQINPKNIFEGDTVAANNWEQLGVTVDINNKKLDSRRTRDNAMSLTLNLDAFSLSSWPLTGSAKRSALKLFKSILEQEKFTIMLMSSSKSSSALTQDRKYSYNRLSH